MRKIVMNWSKIAKTNKKNKNKRAQAKPPNMLDALNNEHRNKSSVSDLNSMKNTKTGKRKSTHIRNPITNNLTSATNLNSSLNRSMCCYLIM